MDMWYCGRDKWHWSPGRSYIIRLMKTGRLIMYNMRNIHNTLNHYRTVPPGTDFKRDWMVRRHFHRGKISWAGSGIPPIYSPHRHIYCTIAGVQKIQRALQSNRAQNWLQEYCTWWQYWLYHEKWYTQEYHHIEQSRLHKKLNKDQIRSDKSQTQKG